MNSLLRHAAFVTGLAALVWVGAGYAGVNALALAVTALIAAFYLMGALDLRRFRRATSALAQAVAELPAALSELQPWLDRVPQALRNTVRRRIEGEHASFAGPALASTLAGLVVLLGMLGTFLGMVLTLRGTGMALDSATDLQAVRNSLVAPVKGLGVAFGTSIAGVAASAALGLMAALARAERLQAAQALDGRIATTLRPFSLARQREASLALLQRQADLMPALVDGLRALGETMARQAHEAQLRQQAGQDDFHARTELAVTRLTQSVDRSLRDSLGESARLAGAAMRPAVEAAMAAVAREAATLHEQLAATAQRQVGELAGRFEAVSTRMADTWQALLARHESSSQGLAEGLQAALGGSAQAFEQRAAGLLAAMEQRSAAVLDGVAQRHGQWQGEMAQTLAGINAQATQALAEMTRQTAQIRQASSDAAATQLAGVSARLDDTVQRVSATWDAAVARQESAGAAVARQTGAALATAAAAFGQHAAALLATVGEAHAQLQAGAAAREQQRLDAMTQAIEGLAQTLRGEWQQAGAQTLAQQERICATLEQSAAGIQAQAEAHARSTTAEIARLLQAAAEAPRAAAEVVAELRQKLSDSMARDNSLLDERARILETLGSLLDGINRAATEQRAAIDALVASSATMLDRVGERFAAQVDAEAGKLSAVAAQVTGSAVEVASLGEAFGFGVELFSRSNDKLVDQLQRIDGALGKSLARSDEQLAYYVAQAREVIDLSILSQRQIIEDLQRLSSRAAPAEVATR